MDGARWDPLSRRPAPPERAGVVLTPDMIEVVAQAAKYLRAREPEEAFIARGMVKKLERTGEERSGTAQVLAFVRGDIRRVTFEVVGDQWDSVHLALASRDVVVVEGELVAELGEARGEFVFVFVDHGAPSAARGASSA